MISEEGKNVINRFIALEEKANEAKKITIEYEETLKELIKHVPIGKLFKLENGIIYKLVPQDGHYVEYRPISVIKTRSE
jgi:hypothetical protein